MSFTVVQSASRRLTLSIGAILLARAWIFWDWFRMAGTLAPYLCFVKAAS